MHIGKLNFGCALLISCGTLLGIGCSDDDDGSTPSQDAGTQADAATGTDASSTGTDASSTGTDAGSTGTDAAVADTGTAGNGYQFCQEECAEDDDCMVGGTDIGFTCNSGRCTRAVAGCTEDASCVAQANGWFYPSAGTTPCAADADCPGQVCVEGGYCATAPSQYLACTTLSMIEVTIKAIDGTTDVTVCGRANTDDAVCDGGTCRNPCNGDEDCSSAQYPTCNAGTGTCVCADSPDSCAGATIGGTVCQASGVCGCSADADCLGAGFDTCYSGICGCGDATACTNALAFSGTTHVCE
ncbi:MAG: hypothetical protein IPK13_15415 [Deltaproteobacteria bacterium]|nr:hypothetical protein [Deltaproteobacteria bacterium]